jgi:nitrile hydratase beta subunit
VNGIHDMGGMDGFGPVEVERDEPVFHAPWEGRVFGINSFAMAATGGNIDAFRHAIERIPPVDYLALGYYGRWLAAAERVLVEFGWLRPGEVDARLAGRPGPTSVERPPPAQPGQPGARRERSSDPRFRVAQAVRVRNLQPRGHTRLAGYVRAKRGEIALVHPDAWVLPDTHAHGQGEHAQPVYSVRFRARELWGDEAPERDSVHIDLFESYLEETSS